MLTGDMREAAALREAADGATQHAIFALLDNSPTHWEADGAEHIVRIGSAIVTGVLLSELLRLARISANRVMRPTCFTWPASSH